MTVSLNAADPETYDLLCRPTFSKSFREVIRFAEACVEAGIPTTLTAVDVPEADADGCRAIADGPRRLVSPAALRAAARRVSASR